MRIAQWLLLSSLLVWSLGCDRLPQGRAAAPGSAMSSAAPAPGSVLSLGQTAVLATQRVKLVSLRACDGTAEPSHRSPNRAWAVELEITNTAPSPIPVNPFYATLEDAQNFVYTTSLSGCTPLLAARFVQSGETVRGYVPFVLPRNTAIATLSYRSAARGDSGASARFHVEP